LAGIFISYRREDSAGYAGRLFADLKRRFAQGQIFIDVAGIALGRDYRKVVDEHVSGCDVLLAVIGREWAGVRQDQPPRLQDPKDLVRIEIASALKRDIPVVPVLVEGASMPRQDELPSDLEPLSFRNAIELRHERWDDDVAQLMEALDPIVAKATSRRASSPQTPAPSKRPLLVGGVAAVVLLAALALYLWFQGEGPRPSPTPSPLPTTVAPPTPTARPVTPEATPIPTSEPVTPSPEPTGRPEAPTIRMPNVTGSDMRSSAALLEMLGLKVTGRPVGAKRDVPAGTVLEQVPVPGTELKKGDRVLLTWAREALVSMPNLVGLDVKAAMAKLQAAGFVLRKRTADRTSSARPYTVIRQEPAPDALAKRGSDVELTYAAGPAAHKKPDDGTR
jgi:TIR domain/PASTA domain